MDELIDSPIDTKDHLKNVLIQQQQLMARVQEVADKLDAMGRGIEKQEHWLKKFIADVMKYAISILKL